MGFTFIGHAQPIIDNPANDPFYVTENEPIGTTFGQIQVSGGAAPYTYAFVSGDDGDFTINASGEFVVNVALDVNIKNQYNVIVEVTDANTNTTQGSFVLNLNDFNYAPEISPQSLNVDENSPVSTVVTNPNVNSTNNEVIASDKDGDNLVYSITAGDPNGFFDINAQGQITVANNISHEANPSFSLSVTVTETGNENFLPDGNKSATATISVAVNDLNEAPTITVGQSFTISEIATNNDVVGTVLADDPDIVPAFNQLSYSFVPVSPVFAIDNDGQITVTDDTQLDFNTTPQYTLTVETTDGTFSASEPITINVEEFIGVPSIEDQDFTLAENPNQGEIIGTVVATDPDTDLSGLSFIIIAGDGANAFGFQDNGVLVVEDSITIDFETIASYALSVRVTDGTNADTATVSIDITNINEAPVLENKTITIPENQPINAVLGETGATDVDSQNLTYSILSGNTSQAYSLSASGSIVVSDANYFDFETFTPDTLSIRVFDQELADTARFIIRLTNVNEGLTIDDASFSIEENSPNNVTVGSLSADDIDGDALTFTIESGNIDEAFSLTGRVLSVNNSEVLDFETTPSFTLQVSATDGEFTETATVVIELIDVFELVNDRPQITSQFFVINENEPEGTVIGTVVASDSVSTINGEPELIDNLITFSILSQSVSDAVAIDPNSGRLTVKTPSAFNFESPGFENIPSITIQVNVSDGELSRTAPINITIFDVEEPPSIEDQTYTIPENTQAGTLIDKVDAFDGDGEVSVRIASGNINGAFFMNASGTLTVQNPTPLNFEVNPEIVLVVEAFDEVDTVSANVTIVLTDVNDPPRLEAKLFNIDENPAQGDSIGNVMITDEDGLGNVSLTILEGNIEDAVLLDNNGLIFVNNEDAFDFELTRTITLQVLVEDGDFSFTEIVEVTINDVIDNLLITDVEEELQIKFYPNPVRDRLTVELPGLDDQRILVSDLSGKILWQALTNKRALLEINTTSYKPGIYLLMVGNHVFKFRKQ